MGACPLKWATALSIFVILVDITLTSIFIMLGFEVTGKNVQLDIDHFQFSSSLSDIWIQSLARSCVVFGALLGVARNVPDGQSRLVKFKKGFKYFGICMELFLVVKLLYWAEDNQEGLKWQVWLLFSSSFLLNIIAYGVIIVLCSVKKPRVQRAGNRHLLWINSVDSVLQDIGDEDQSHLPNEEDTDDEDSSDSASIASDNLEDKDGDVIKTPTWTVVRKLFILSKPDLGYLLLGFFFLLACSLAEVFLPLYTGEVINSIAIEKSYGKFKQSIAIMSLISVGAGICAGLRGGILSFVTARFTIRLQNDLYANVLDQEVGFYDTRKTGELISRLTSDTTKVGDQIALNANVFLRNLVKIIGVLVFMFKLSWKLTLLTLVGLPLIFEIYGSFGSYYEALSEKVQSSLASANESAAETIAAIRTVKSFGAEDIEKSRYRGKLKLTFALKIKESISYGGFICINEMLDLIFELLVLFYGGHLVLSGDLSGGYLVSFILYDLELGNCLEDIGDIYTGLMEAVGAARKVFFYLQRPAEISQNGRLMPLDFHGRVEFTNVTFSYPSRPDVPVLKDLTFTASPGEVIALVGPSGGGKSTIVSLLEHFYEPQSGTIKVDGIQLNDYDHKFLHTKMTLVAQEPVLFARSVSENITYAMREEVSHECVVNAATQANISQFINDLPSGYDTETGEKGVQLSGGQKQRVAIARALIRNPSILILDEATSALDSESEFLVQDAINRNLAGRTVLIIAHRLSTIEKADKILVIEKGILVEEGTHNELFLKDGIYAALVKRQMLSIADTGTIN